MQLVYDHIDRTRSWTRNETKSDVGDLRHYLQLVSFAVTSGEWLAHRKVQLPAPAMLLTGERSGGSDHTRATEAFDLNHDGPTHWSEAILGVA